MTTDGMNEKARYPGDRYGSAKNWDDGVCTAELPSHICRTELSSRKSVTRNSVHLHEMHDASFPTELATSALFQRQESPELLDPIKSESGRRSLWQKFQGTPAIDPRYSTAKQSNNDFTNICNSGNTISPIAREASKMGDLSNSALHTQSDRNSKTITVSTDITRESSDSSGASMEFPWVETTISSSPRSKSVDLNSPLPTPPHCSPWNSNKPLPSMPKSNSAQSPSIKSTSSHRFSVMDRIRRMSCRTSASNSDSEIVECASTNTSPDLIRKASDLNRESNRRTWSPTQIDIFLEEMLAGNALSDEITCPEEPTSNYASWNTLSPSTLAPTADYPASAIVSPSSANPTMSPLWSDVFPPISPIASPVSPQATVVFPVTSPCENSHLGSVEHLEDANSDWVLPSSSLLESATEKLEHTLCALNTSEPNLPTQRPISHTAVTSASGAEWTNIHHRAQSEMLDAPSLLTWPHLSKIESFVPAGSLSFAGIDELLDPEAPSSMIKPSTTQFDTLQHTWSPENLLSPPEQHVDSNFMDGSMEIVREGVPVSVLTPVITNISDHGLYKRPLPVDGNGTPHPLNSACASEKRPGVTLRSRRQLKVPPLAISSRQRAKAASGSFHPSLVSLQSQNKDLQKIGGEVAGSGCNDASVHCCRPNLPNGLNSASSARKLPHCFDHQALLVTHSTLKQTQVKELLDLVLVINSVWLESIPELRRRCSVPSPRGLFERGIWTLKEHFRGKFTQTFEDVFAFIHVAFSAAFLLHCQQNFFCWDAFYNDALQWQHTLPDGEDRTLFLKAMDCCWWLPELQSNPSLNNNSDTSSSSIISWEFLKNSDHIDRLDALRNSEVFKACIGFLDGKSTLLSFET